VGECDMESQTGRQTDRKAGSKTKTERKTKTEDIQTDRDTDVRKHTQTHTHARARALVLYLCSEITSCERAQLASRVGENNAIPKQSIILLNSDNSFTLFGSR
jgi:hypothetical protein